MNNELVKVENNEIIIDNEVSKKIREFYETKTRIELLEKELKEEVKTKMEELNKFDTIKNDDIKIVYKKASFRKSLDTKRIKEELPEVYEEFLKETNVNSSVSIQIW